MQPRILSTFEDSFGRFHIVDEDGETVLPHCCTGGTNFALSVDWAGGRAECHWSHTADEPNNRSYVNVELWCGTSGFNTHGDFVGTIRNGWDTAVSVPGVSIWGDLVKVTGVEHWVDHAADGSLNIPIGIVSGEVLNTSFNAVSGVQTFTLSDYARVPGAVATPTASAVTASGMTWSWNAPASAVTITEYLLEYSSSSGFANSTVVSTGTSRSKAITGLAAGTKYYARVGARSADGWSPEGGHGSQLTLPGSPSGLTLGSFSTTGMTANWADTTSATSYEIQYATNSAFTGATTKSPTASTYAITGLTAGTVYYVRVRAKNGTGAGGWSSTVSGITLPGTPTGLALSAFTASGMTANWADTPGASSYEIQYGTSSSFSGATGKTVTPSTYAITGLTGGTRYYVRVRAKNASGVGAYTAGVNSITLPAAPTSLALSAITPTGMTATWSKGPNGIEITEYDVTWANNSSFTGATTVTSTTTTKALTGMSPGATHWVKVRAKNGNGVGAYSSVASTSSLPSNPPGLAVVSSPDGKSAQLTFSPPGGITGVDQYKYEYRVKSPVGTAVPGTSTTTAKTVSSLTPGQTYEWRASAVIDAYTSPWSTWLTKKQEKPNTAAGDYFDGATTDTTDLDYAWTSGANASTSTATAKNVTGWQAIFTSPSSGVIHRITGGRFNSYAARVQVNRDSAVELSIRAGQSNDATGRSDVAEDGTYVGSIYVRPSRAQSLAAEITWVDGAGASVGTRAIGAPTSVPSDQWVRLVVGGVAPTGAVYGLVRAVDVDGPGWSIWLGGDTLDLDGAMLTLTAEVFPYFDGSTTDNATYLYDWMGTAHASVSKRTSVAVSGPQADGLSPSTRGAILDPNCLPPAPPRPPTVPNECISEEVSWRRYFEKIPTVDVPDWLDAVPTFVIITQGEEASQVRIRYYENPTDAAPEEVDTTHWISEQIISYIPKNTEFTVDGVHQRVWAEVDGGESQAADHLLYGSNGAPPTWPILSCGISYVISLDLPVAIKQGDSRFYGYVTTRY
jgi:hypothetical protein